MSGAQDEPGPKEQAEGPPVPPAGAEAGAPGAGGVAQGEEPAMAPASLAPPTGFEVVVPGQPGPAPLDDRPGPETASAEPASVPEGPEPGQSADAVFTDPPAPVPSAPVPEDAAPPARLRRRAPRRAGRDRALGFRLFLVLLVFSVIAVGFSLRVRPLALPVPIVAEVEERLNGMSGPVLPSARLSLGGIELMLDRSWAPVFRLQDLRLIARTGAGSFLALPEAEMALDASALLRGRILPRHLRISGAQIDLRRDLEGRLDLVLGQGAAPQIQHLAEVFDGLDLMLRLPELAALRSIELDALGLSLHDERLGRTWHLGDGRLVIENRAQELAAELSLSLLERPGAGARMTVISEKGSGSARLRAVVSGIPATELAAQHPVLSWMQAVQAPISGEIAVRLDRVGVTALEGRLALGAGALQPGPDTTPIAFTGAGLSLLYDPAEGRLRLSGLSVESRTLRASGSGQLFLLDDNGQIRTGVLSGRSPAAFLGQLSITDLAIDPEGQFVSPVQFSHGALDLRLTPDPFRIEIGQFVLAEGAQRLSLSGAASAAEGGWEAALDFSMNEVSVKRLVQLWPLQLVPRTRAWVARNLLTGDLTDVSGGVRLVPGAEPKLHLGYDYSGTDIRFLPLMPPIRGGSGYSVIDGKVNTIVLTKGTLAPPQGGVLDLAGSSMRVADIYARPAIAEITLRASGPAEAMLSALDQKPFEFLTKAGRPVALGSGAAVVQARIRTPLVPGGPPKNVDFTASASVAGFGSEVLIAGRKLEVPALSIRADRSGMTASGAGTLDGVPFDGFYRLPFGPQPGPARIVGRAELSERAVAAFDLGLPEGMVRGASSGRIEVVLTRGQPPRLTLRSDLRGTALAIPELGWSKPAAERARLEVEADLSSPPRVNRLQLDAPDLAALGRVNLRADGSLDRAVFERVTMGRWLDGAVEIEGSSPLSFAVTSGAIDFRQFPGAAQRRPAPGGAPAGAPLSLRLSEFRVSDGIRLSDFQGDFTLRGDGVKGSFSARMGEGVQVTGDTAPTQYGTAVRARADNAGAALKAAGIFETARGGTLDLTLTPRAEPGHYDGRAELANPRVIGGNVLADLLNAVSVIGLLEQLNGEGIVFTRAEADFVLRPGEVEIERSSAVGASMGVSMEGAYQTGGGALAMEGVISPIYLLNGIGAFLTRPGEGLFGFTYRLGGTADAPQVSVNPLSILTPGMFRDIFRTPAPKTGGDAP